MADAGGFWTKKRKPSGMGVTGESVFVSKKALGEMTPAAFSQEEFKKRLQEDGVRMVELDAHKQKLAQQAAVEAQRKQQARELRQVAKGGGMTTTERDSLEAVRERVRGGNYGSAEVRNTAQRVASAPNTSAAFRAEMAKLADTVEGRASRREATLQTLKRQQRALYANAPSGGRQLDRWRSSDEGRAASARYKTLKRREERVMRAKLLP